jgi:hypothetical protein
MRARGVALLIAAFGLVVLVGGALYVWRVYLGREPEVTGSSVEAQSLHSDKPVWKAPQPKAKSKKVSDTERDEVLSRAQFWQQPDTPIEAVDFAKSGEAIPQVNCRFHVTELGGTTPKFDCHLENGELVRVKYGKTGEVPAEVATTRLLRALGFGADQVTYVERLHCYGCPKEPFSVMKAVEVTKAEALYKKLMLSYDDYEPFTWAAVERKFEGRAIETEKLAGWAMFELDKVQPAKGGAPRAHVDALRLFALFVAHWDNKSENQRLVCRSQDDWKEGQRCDRPFALLQDVGATFGPSKVDLEAWKAAPIWEDRGKCLTSMRKLPFNGATYGEAAISEAGRRFLADKLANLSERQIVDLFTTSRFDDAVGMMRRTAAITDWVTAFKARVRQIAEGPACPSMT